LRQSAIIGGAGRRSARRGYLALPLCGQVAIIGRLGWRHAADAVGALGGSESFAQLAGLARRGPSGLGLGVLSVFGHLSSDPSSSFSPLWG
jgi:hypothetical protein